ncbi:DUF2249 domain-containing protein [Kribbella sp. NPDC048928]|uniref:DUF2249 domain-containing protein n=1 Tax=Kribbella sp. NPDC048928 TaxID=3364111 RepID=UPI003724A93D
MAAAEIYIQATETDPVVIARTALGKKHQRLRSRLVELTLVEPSDGADQAPIADLAAFCRHELREYLAAADRDLETAASGPVAERLLVDALRIASAALDQQINDLAVASASESIRIATMIAGALEVYLRVEEFVRPALAELSAEGETGDAPAVIDVRQIARGGRHPRVFARYARLAPGETFVLVNSHDPKPLRREFEAMHPGAFSWDYLQTGPEEWRVRIGRAAVDA